MVCLVCLVFASYFSSGRCMGWVRRWSPVSLPCNTIEIPCFHHDSLLHHRWSWWLELVSVCRLAFPIFVRRALGQFICAFYHSFHFFFFSNLLFILHKINNQSFIWIFYLCFLFCFFLSFLFVLIFFKRFRSLFFVRFPYLDCTTTCKSTSCLPQRPFSVSLLSSFSAFVISIFFCFFIVCLLLLGLWFALYIFWEALVRCTVVLEHSSRISWPIFWSCFMLWVSSSFHGLSNFLMCRYRLFA